MSSIVSSVVGGYRYVFEDLTDPRTRDWFLTGTPWPALALLGFYLYFIFSLGPRLMEKREPFKLERVMQVYNFIQIVISAYIFYRGLVLGWLKDYSYRCQPVDYSTSPRAMEIAGIVWFYFIVKIVDLLDTVFFVLRKKQSQISFLHVYHHAGMVVATWGGVKYLAGGHITFLGLINSFVHVIMYSYYLATSLKIRVSPDWKKHITQLQIIQFFFLLMHFAQLFWVESCGFPVWPAFIFIPQNLLMIYLFGRFYYDAYVKPKKKTAIRNGRIREVADKSELNNNDTNKKED